jgi:hypothetical protein
MDFDIFMLVACCATVVALLSIVLVIGLKNQNKRSKR